MKIGEYVVSKHNVCSLTQDTAYKILGIKAYPQHRTQYLLYVIDDTGYRTVYNSTYFRAPTIEEIVSTIGKNRQ